jgi:DNA-binding NtrC family response regulator
MPHRLLVVDDDRSILHSLSEALAASCEVHTAEDGERALGLVAELRPDVVLADVRMPGQDGFHLLRAVRTRHPATDVILMTAFDDLPTVAMAMRDGAADFLVKPLDLHELRRVLDRVLDDRQTKRRKVGAPDGLQRDAPELIGHDPRMIAIFKMVGQTAGTRATILIRGESGTGKELIARAIHANSRAVSEPFVAVNCSALPPTLLESELFGHVRGAFSGAIASRRGRFAAAGQGTIFLDEIGDTSLEFQSKLLRVLQEREFQPLGSDRVERTDARVIAATHRNLEAMIASQLFRDDLYYRLRVVEIAVPPLRDRRSDLPALALHLLSRASAALRRPAAVLSQEALDAIVHHDWPGNVRELENCLRRATILATGGVIHEDHLGITPAPAESAAPLASLADVEREHVARVMTATRGHKARAARILGVSRPRLNRLLRQYGLEE